MAKNGKLKGEDALALALARGLTVRAAADEAGIGERTAHRRLEDAQFRRRVSKVRCQVMEAAAGRLASAATRAADTLLNLLESESEQTQLAAARTILQQAVALRELGELEERISQLEQQQENMINETAYALSSA